MTKIIEVTDATFEQDVLQGKGVILVDFWAPWCGPCRAMSPILDVIAADYPDKIQVVKVNIDENKEISERYAITSIPAMKVFFRGEILKSIVGAKPKPALLHDLTEFLVWGGMFPR
jgi:thioredoxin 1